ncbi:sensor histidine kinase [Methylocystis heyeri]|uniref:sensor histidine kinase n=1 Tax=Methylocystis heyeri TaxID=391905 RepID=UPI0013896C59|nr:ATP-binding protein [Methylocystis heyeri]
MVLRTGERRDPTPRSTSKASAMPFHNYAWLTTLIDTSFASRFLVDAQGTIVHANAAAEALFGYEHGEFAGKPIDILFSPEADELVRSNLDRPMRVMIGDDRELRGRRKEGTDLILRVGVTPIQTVSENYVSVTVFDVTQYKKIESELRFRTRQLEEINSRLSRFAYVAAHDLQEPLRKIASFSDLLKIAVADDDPATAKYACEVVHNSALRARGLVEGLLEYCSDISAILKLEFINVGAEIEQVEGDFSELIKATGARIENRIQDGLKVRADRAQFTRMMSNMLSNSIKFHKEGENPIIRICACQKDGEIRLSVNDNGIGFEPRYAETIFEPFLRLQPGKEFPGNGIGLAAVKSICDRHGWTIKAESAPGRGATFRVSIPESLALEARTLVSASGRSEEQISFAAGDAVDRAQRGKH